MDPQGPLAPLDSEASWVSPDREGRGAQWDWQVLL